MRVFSHTLIAAAVLALSVSRAGAQSPADPTGHWTGTIDIQTSTLAVDVDLARAASGEMTGVVSIPAQNVKALPLANVAVEGAAVRFQMIQSAAGDNLFKGVLSADARTMTGVFTHEPYEMKFEMTRTGAAQIAAPARNSAIDAALEGAWTGALDVQGQALHVVLNLARQADGTATGTLVSVDQGATIPLSTITQTGAALRVDVSTVGGVYDASYDSATHRLVGTWTQGAITLPLTLTKDAPQPIK